MQAIKYYFISSILSHSTYLYNAFEIIFIVLGWIRKFLYIELHDYVFYRNSNTVSGDILENDSYRHLQ